MVAEDIRAEMGVVFDRPTPATLNSLYIQSATKQKLEARVWIKDGRGVNGKGNVVGREGAWGKGRAASTWLTPEIYGGPRSDKGIEKMLRRKGVLKQGQYIVPGNRMELDAYGNIPKGTLNKIISGASLFTEEGYSANATGSKRSRAKGNAKRYFVMHNAKREPFAVAERTGSGRSGLRVVLAFAGARRAIARPSTSSRSQSERLSASCLDSSNSRWRRPWPPGVDRLGLWVLVLPDGVAYEGNSSPAFTLCMTENQRLVVV